MPDNQMERIKKLIRKGFDLELISFELDIPMEKLQEGKKQVEKENQDEIKSFQMLKREEMEQIDLTIFEIEEVVKDIEGKAKILNIFYTNNVEIG